MWQVALRRTHTSSGKITYIAETELINDIDCEMKTGGCTSENPERFSPSSHIFDTSHS